MGRTKRLDARRTTPEGEPILPHQGAGEEVSDTRGVHGLWPSQPRNGAGRISNPPRKRGKAVCRGHTTAQRPDTFEALEYLRKDQVFLFERFFYFLEERREHGILVFDEVEKGADLKFVRQVERYFTRTQAGRYRTVWIVPTPLFVSSDLTYPTQAADLCIYAINWGFRLPSHGMDAPGRTEVTAEFRQWIADLQYRGRGQRGGQSFETYGIVYVPDPYEPRERKSI